MVKAKLPGISTVVAFCNIFFAAVQAVIPRMAVVTSVIVVGVVGKKKSWLRREYKRCTQRTRHPWRVNGGRLWPEHINRTARIPSVYSSQRRLYNTQNNYPVFCSSNDSAQIHVVCKYSDYQAVIHQHLSYNTMLNNPLPS